MARPQEDNLLDIYISEYEKLKQEQIARIGFRDNLIYATLIALTAVVSIVADDTARIPVLLVLPMVCIALGWTYLVNDEKISAIGRYIRLSFSDRVRELIKSKDAGLFGWETAHRSDTRRGRRKVIQFFVDEFMFFLPGLVAIIIFWFNASGSLLLLKWIAIIELLFLLILGVQLFSYADFGKGK
jgi:hypothetical protein